MLSLQSSLTAVGRLRRAWIRSRRNRLSLAAAVLVCLAAFEAPTPAQSQSALRPVKGELTMSTAGGFGRLVIRLEAELDAEVRVSSGVLIVQFKQPVNVPVDRAPHGAPPKFRPRAPAP